MLSQFRGCLLGLACGDALGGPLKCMSADEIARTHGTARELRGGGWLHLRPGQVTDGTEQMLLVLESYLENGAFDPHDIAERLLEWYRAGPVDLGALTREACENLLYGYNFERAGFEAWQSAPEGARLDGGSLARATPAGLMHYHDHVHLIGESRVISSITHYDERCKLGCACLSLALAHLLLVGVDGLLDELLEWIEPRNTVLGYALRAIPGLRVAELRTGGSVVETLQSALWAVLYCDEFEEGLTLLGNRGGDAGTVCAVAGALLGARFGVEAIPERWLRVLEPRERIDHGAERLYVLAQGE
jgi:ADP-ribosyl-[dinitrogen reductase] hydrolase